ncbi:hypothetical protein HPG69_000003 [Diceros bicornis minor]|uniref:GSKIP domain-containing protein n=1 Tax=Diceros bicornis minor TaxID=77932 RepID=A0A7J7ENQ8_DICBM|nr:hypothetical protein HPG69_000003 [Diceros bicornis minor]
MAPALRPSAAVVRDTSGCAAGRRRRPVGSAEDWLWAALLWREHGPEEKAPGRHGLLGARTWLFSSDGAPGRLPSLQALNWASPLGRGPRPGFPLRQGPEPGVFPVRVGRPCQPCCARLPLPGSSSGPGASRVFPEHGSVTFPRTGGCPAAPRELKVVNAPVGCPARELKAQQGAGGCVKVSSSKLDLRSVSHTWTWVCSGRKRMAGYPSLVKEHRVRCLGKQEGDTGCSQNGNRLTDIKDMRLESEAVVNNFLFAVNNMFVSKNLRCAGDVVYSNVETRERNRYCLELTEAGLRVVGYAFDQVDDHLQTPYHETLYSLLDTLSPAYWEAFGNTLSKTGSFEKGWTVMTQPFPFRGSCCWSKTLT